ncbi:MAG: YbgC/FadM family acyl-CoA thioesterase [Pseudomonadota bacterium]
MHKMEPQSVPNSQKLLPYETRVHWDDTDAGGIVYHARYVIWAERARSDLLRKWGFGSRKLLEHDRLAFIVHKLTLHYHAPAYLDDLLHVHSRFARLAGARLIMEQQVWCNERILVKLDLTLACITPGKGPCRIPSFIADKIRPLL